MNVECKCKLHTHTEHTFIYKCLVHLIFVSPFSELLSILVLLAIPLCSSLILAFSVAFSDSGDFIYNAVRSISSFSLRFTFAKLFLSPYMLHMEIVKLTN